MTGGAVSRRYPSFRGNRRGNFMGRVLIAALAAAAIGISTPAVAAITIGGSGASTTLTINGSTAVNDFVLLTLNGQADNVVYPGLSSTLKLTFKGASANLDGGT